MQTEPKLDALYSWIYAFLMHPFASEEAHAKELDKEADFQQWLEFFKILLTREDTPLPAAPMIADIAVRMVRAKRAEIYGDKK